MPIQRPKSNFGAGNNVRNLRVGERVPEKAVCNEHISYTYYVSRVTYQGLRPQVTFSVLMTSALRGIT